MKTKLIVLTVITFCLAIWVNTLALPAERTEIKQASVLELRPRRIIQRFLTQNEPDYTEAADITTEPPEQTIEKVTTPGGHTPFIVSETTQSPKSYAAPAGGLTKSKGVHQGPSGKETWYNLPMGGVIKIMRGQGYTEQEYPYWIRDDGCRMFGEYIMIAANLELRPRGTVIETSLGAGIVCDTGSFATKDHTAIDIAVNW